MANTLNFIYILLAGALAVIALVASSYGLLLFFRGSDARVRSRVRQFVASPTRTGVVTEGAERDKLRAALFAGIDTRWERFAVFKKIRADLERADLHLTVSEVALLQICVGIAVAVTLWLLSPSVALLNLLLVPVGFLIGAYLVRAYIPFVAGRRLRRFEDQLPDTLSLLASSVRGGFSLFQALQLLARESPEPSKTEYLRVVQEMSLGATLDTALGGLSNRIPTEDIDILVTAITLQAQTGGSLAHILDVLAHTVRERHRVQREIRSLTAQARFSAYLLAMLPISLLGVMFVISPTYISHLFKPGWVLCMPIGALIMSIVGFFSMKKIASIDV